MPRTPPAARRATTADVPALSRALARAFQDDPVMVWACPNARRRPEHGRRFFGARLRQLLPHAEVWTTDALDGAALWAPAGEWHASLRETLELLPATIAGRSLHRLPLVLPGLARVEARHPHEPHAYLAVLGADPAAQGRGVGSALLEPVLRTCDEDGVAAYLESSKERNLAYYARHGFRVREELDLPRGPRVWLMWRDPR
ncbi:MAG TPA: GNAT family N-acetyltransferase [Solirubrobacteraceae bacterium]|nr:GNAT family N-acetyltransferase [Solirubrobacteraceae bacterium]